MWKNKCSVNYRDLSYLNKIRKSPETYIITVVILARPESPY